MLSSKADLEKVGAYLGSTTEETASNAALPKPDSATIQALLDDQRLALETVELVDEKQILEPSNQFVQDYELGDLPTKADAAAKDGTLAIDPISIGIYTAVWLLVQTEIEFESEPDPDQPGEYKWKLNLKKKGTPAPSLLTLLKFLTEHFVS